MRLKYKSTKGEHNSDKTYQNLSKLIKTCKNLTKLNKTNQKLARGSSGRHTQRRGGRGGPGITMREEPRAVSLAERLRAPKTEIRALQLRSARRPRTSKSTGTSLHFAGARPSSAPESQSSDPHKSVKII